MDYKRTLGLNSFEALEFILMQFYIRPIFQFLFLPLETFFQKKKLSISPLVYIKFYYSKIFLDLFFWIFLKLKYLFKKGKFFYKGKEIIFSLTSIEGREDSLKYSLMSLLLQKTPFNSIHVYLPRVSLDIIKKNKNLFNVFLKEGINFNIKNNALGTHRKYIFNSNLHEKFHMCLVDDDYFYDQWVLTDLIYNASLSKTRISTLYKWKIRWKKNKQYPEKRQNWQKSLINPVKNSSDLFTYVDDAYTFYESKLFSREFFNIKNIQQLCTMKITGIIGFDDDWIKWNLYKKKYKVSYSRRWSLINSVSENIAAQKKNNHAYLSSTYDNADKIVENLIEFLNIK
tara:strand:- start:35375 stop:36400 length:1026 start_codon:yes stop_codon:yes gene_type:complete